MSQKTGSQSAREAFQFALGSAAQCGGLTMIHTEGNALRVTCKMVGRPDYSFDIPPGYPIADAATAAGAALRSEIEGAL